MESKEEIIINDTAVIKQPKKRKPLTEAQKLKKKEDMKIYYQKIKNDPEYKERQRQSSKEHYYRNKDVVLQRMKVYRNNRTEVAQIEMLSELQQEYMRDLHAGDLTEEEFEKLQNKINNKLAHLHLTQDI